MNIVVKEGKVLEDVLEKVLKELEVEKNEILFRETKKKGGLFKAELIEIQAVNITEVTDFMKDLLKEILSNMGLEVTFESKIRDNQITIKMYSDKNNILIGRNGQTLAALQAVLRQAVNTQTGMYPYIILDVENYKDKQLIRLERLAKNVAREVATTKVEAKLESMNSYERRIIHSVLSENKKVFTTSEGEEPNRCIVIKPKED